MMRNRTKHDRSENHEKSLRFCAIESAGLSDSILNIGVIRSENASEDSSACTAQDSTESAESAGGARSSALHHSSQSAKDTAEAAQVVEDSGMFARRGV